jgi:hypothetical protein
MKARVETMKKLTTVAWLPAMGFLLAGCLTSQSPGAAGRHFHEGATVNVVLQFSGWDYTFLVKPPYSENGFLQPVRRENIRRVFERLNVRRDLAVVVVGWTYTSQELNRLVAEWKSILDGCGFQRVVVLRPNTGNKLNGSLIIDDSNSSFSSAQPAAPFPRAGS